MYSDVCWEVKVYGKVKFLYFIRILIVRDYEIILVKIEYRK